MYHVSRNGSNEGPFDSDVVAKMISSGALNPDDHLWKDGWDGWRAVSAEFANKSAAISPPQLPSATAVFTMKGVNDFLSVFPDKVEITPRGILGTLNKGFKGTKTIPFHSITAIQFKRSGVLSGYLQFSIPGGMENRSGILAATKDENTFMFAGANGLALQIKNYIEAETAKLRLPQPAHSSTASVADEIAKLAGLREKGLLSDEEFSSAKATLLK